MFERFQVNAKRSKTPEGAERFRGVEGAFQASSRLDGFAHLPERGRFEKLEVDHPNLEPYALSCELSSRIRLDGPVIAPL